MGSADQSTPPNTQPVTQQLSDGPRPQQPGGALGLAEVEDAASRAARRTALQDHGARGPGPGVQVGHQPLGLPDHMTRQSGGHAAEPRDVGGHR